MKKKFATEIFFIILLILFAIYRNFQNGENVVLKVFSPIMYAIDFNGNRQIDNNEIVCLSGVRTFNDSLITIEDELAEKFNVSKKNSIVFVHKSRDFVQSELQNKSVNFTPEEIQNNSNCIEGDVFLQNGASFRKKLLDNGYVYSEKFEYNAEKFKELLELSSKITPVIFNRKSKKYHEIDCKYGTVSEKFAILLKNELPQDAIPCKWCHHENNLEEKSHPTQESTFPNRITDDKIRMFLTDMSTHLKVQNDCSSDICKAFLNEINNTQTSLDIATYGWVSIPQIDEAIKSAVKRGVRFRIVYDFTSKNNHYPDTQEIARYAIDSRNDFVGGNTTQSEYLMHNKFMIFDGKKVATGSLNYSKTDFSEFNSNAIFFIDSPDVAKVYTEEFEQMLSGKFHSAKHKRNNIDTYKLGNSLLQVYFSPQDKAISDKILPYINSAKKYIYIPAFVITHKKLENALILAKSRGVDVKLIIDATNVSAQKSSVKALRQAEIPIKIENFAGKLHSKSIIIDDEYIFAGSMNFSNSGENKNDENLLIIKNPRLATYYHKFFTYLWDKIPDKYLTQNPRAEGKDSVGSCFDGIDNDFDGKIDSQDEGCYVKN